MAVTMPNSDEIVKDFLRSKALGILLEMWHLNFSWGSLWGKHILWEKLIVFVVPITIEIEQ